MNCEVTTTQEDRGRKPKILCLHGYGGSGKILKEELDSRWPKSVIENLDLVFLDAPFIDDGISPEKGRYDPPYYKWFQANKDYSSYENFDECIAYIEEHMTNCVPFDGVLGFSQGALTAAVLPGMQTQGVILNTVPKIKSVIIMSGGKFGGEKYIAPKLAKNAFSSPVDCLSVHFIGEMDYAKPYGLELINSFVDPFVIYHLGEHRVPILDDKGAEIMFSFIEKMQAVL